MTIGILHKGANSIFFNRLPDFWLEVVTGLIILLGMFGWMDLMIYAKWFKPVDIEDTSFVPHTDQYKTFWDYYNKTAPVFADPKTQKVQI